jgi:predicted Fe-Mo cluster-binding NifX family protein
LDSREGDLSDHFGEAPYFALLNVRNADGVVQERRILENPYRDLERGKGLRVAEWLVGKQADEVRLRDRIEHKAPAYVFADAGLNVVQTEAEELETVLEEAKAGKGG